VLDTDDMEAEGMGILLGVAKGSKEPPRLIVLEHKPEQTAAPTLALVGKALTFDSGGLSLKSSKGMNEMKFDMCGGAAVFGAMQAVAELQPDRHVLGLICATENMPGGGAQRPGDVATGLTGQSVEILNTDAEGRLVLSDGVAYAEKLGAEAIVDIATLTGAASVALGDQAAAVISTDDEWAQELAAAGEAASERLWQLPAWPEYRDQFKSDIADLKNVGGRKAGCIVGGLIIGEFVDSARWAHLDIAGVAWADEQKYYRPKGATGFGVRTLVQLALGR
jgi:leucyl aminopeptidase